jgi:hypothetical protein
MADINIDPKNKTIYIGGMVGETAAGKTLTITNASFQGKITLATSTSAQRVGGLIGYTQSYEASQFNNFTAELTRSYIFGSHAVVEILVDGSNAGIGGLVGRLDSGNITKSFVSGSIVNLSTIYNSDGTSGGLVGLLISSNISQSYNLAHVTGADQVGGLVGSFSGNGNTISESFNLGKIQGTSSSTSPVSGIRGVGGLVGASGGGSNTPINIKNSYNKGKVVGHNYVGGIIGELYSLVSNKSKVENSYNASNVSGSANVGAIAGDASNNGEVTESYWDNSFIFPVASNSFGTSKNTADMKLQTTYQQALNPANNWDFDDIWIIEGQSYPTLRNNPEPE